MDQDSIFEELPMSLVQILAELKKSMSFKDTTAAGDIVLVGMKEGLLYGVVLDIIPNVKPEWWDVTFKLLIVPPVNLTWILRTPQMCGEIFTINGAEHFMIAMEIGQPKIPRPSTGKRPALSLIKRGK